MDPAPPTTLPEEQLFRAHVSAVPASDPGIALEPGLNLLIGPAGAGKAAALVRAWAAWDGRGLFHHAGLGGESSDPDVFLWRLLHAIRRDLDFPDAVPLDPAAMRETLPNWLARASACGTYPILLADAHALSRDGLVAELDWLPEWLPGRIVIAVSAPPGPAAEQFRDRAGKALNLAPGDSPGTAPTELVGQILGTPEAARAAMLLWAARGGLTRQDLEALLPGGAASALEQLRPIVIGRDSNIDSDDDSGLTLAGPRVRDAVARRLLADHGDRQRIHEELAGHFSEAARPGDWRLALWHRAAAGRLDLLADWLVDPRALAGLDRPDARFENLRLWQRLGDAQVMRRELARAVEGGGLDPAALLGAADLLAAADGSAPPRDWLERAATAAEEAGEVDLRARALERLAGHADTPPDKVLGLLKSALEIRRTVNGDGAAQTESVRHRIACLHEEQGDLAAAAEAYRTGLAARCAVLGNDHPGLIPWLSNLAAAQKAAGDLKAADESARHALRLARDRLGPGHPTTAACADQLAGVAYMAGRYDAAEPLYREALGIAEGGFGPDHAATAAALNNLGTVLDARQRFREAEQCYRRALAIRMALYGETHEDTATSLHNLAATLEAVGQLPEAEQLYRRALDAWSQVAGEESPAFATTLLNLAELLRERGQWADAEALYRGDIELWRKLVGPDHPHTLNALAGLARLYVEGGKPELAEPLLMHLVETTAEVLGRGASNHLEAVALLAALLRDGGRPEEARSLLEDALAANRNTLNALTAPVQKLKKLLDSLDPKNRSVR